MATALFITCLADTLAPGVGRATVTVLEVVELLEGEVGAGAPEMGAPWSEISESVRATLAATTIADVAQREAEQAGAAMYYI